MKSKPALAVPWFFTLIWSLFTLGFDASIGYFVSSNIRSQWYADTTGTITASRMASSTDSDGDTSYRAEFEFDYVVDGQTRHGTKRRYGESSISGTNVRKTVQAILDRYPVGANVTVHYDPQHPEWAVLESGLGGTDLLLAMFMTPFNLIMLALWAGSLRKIPEDDEGLLAGLVRETGRGYEIRERPSTMGSFLVGVGAAAFIMIFVVLFGIGFEPSLTTMGFVWGVIGLLGLTTVVLVAGAPFGAVIDDVMGEITLRGWFGAAKATVTHTQLQGVRCKRDVSDSDSPDTYNVELLYNDDLGNPQTATVYTSQQPERPQALTKWMRQKLQLTRDPDADEDEEPTEA